MMGHSHAATGAAGWVALAPWTFETVGWGGLAVGTVISAGWALAADLDHHNSTITRALPPVTNVLSSITAALSGGHRKGTHSIFGVAFVTFLAFALSWWSVTVDGVKYAPGPAITTVVAAALAFKALKIAPNAMVSWAASLAAGAAVWFMLPHVPAPVWSFTPNWFVAAVVVGYVIHIVGDALTTEGVPLLWPVSDTHFKVPIIGDTGSPVEGFVVVASVIGAVVVAYPAVTA